MFFFNLEKESGNVFVDTLGQSKEMFEGRLAAIQRAQFCFSGGPDKLALLSLLKIRDMGRSESATFFEAIVDFVSGYWGEVALEPEEYINLLVRSKGIDGGHEFYIVKTRGDKRDEQNFRAFVDDFFSFKTKGIDEIMLSKNLDVVFEDRS